MWLILLMLGRTLAETVEGRCEQVQDDLEVEVGYLEVEVDHLEEELGHLEEEEDHTEQMMTSGFQRSDILQQYSDFWILNSTMLT